MLRPNDVVAWFKLRTERQQTELPQLLDGLLPGGQIVVGGAEAQASKALAMLGMRNRIGRIMSIQQAELSPNMPTTFDTAAIVMLMMTAQNEGFHTAVSTTLAAVLDLTTNHQKSVDEACQIVLEQALQVPQL